MRKFTYEFRFDSGESVSFTVDLDRSGTRSPLHPPPADWTRLDCNRCANCPLRSDQYPHCPVALDLESVARRFSKVLSYEEAEVVVTSEEREYRARCDVQTGLRSLLGLIMGSSACPQLAGFRPLAWFHLPFATLDETLFRVVGSFLLKEYYAARDGRPVNLALPELDALYAGLQVLNTDFMGRLRAASEKDANLNAVNYLFSLSAVVAMTWQERLDELRVLLYPETLSPRPPA